MPDTQRQLAPISASPSGALPRARRLMTTDSTDHLCRVRAAGSDDLPRILELYRQLHPGDPALDSARARDTFHDILAREGMTLFVLELDDRIEATCYLNVIPNLTRSARPYAVIENVVTEEGLRGRGLGKQIIRHVLTAAWKAGCYKVMLQTGSKRESTHAFYRACGFSGTDKQAYVAWSPADT